MNHNRTRAFHMSAAEIVQLLDADDSGDENDDVMDKEDPTFLEEGSDNNRDEVIIEGQNVITESSENAVNQVVAFIHQIRSRRLVTVK